MLKMVWVQFPSGVQMGNILYASQGGTVAYRQNVYYAIIMQYLHLLQKHDWLLYVLYGGLGEHRCWQNIKLVIRYTATGQNNNEMASYV